LHPCQPDVRADRRPFLARVASVPNRVALPVSAVFGLGASGFLLHEHRARQSAERLAAATLETLLKAIDANDPVTGAHVRRVARYALVLGDAADLDEHALRALERIALFHDIGKIHEALFDIVHDDDALTPEERRAIASHPERGAHVLEPLAPFYPELAEGVLSHHECWDGSGYPRKLSGAAIPFVARIVSIADTFDALTHRRRYRPGRTATEAADIIGRGRGTQFDPELTDLFLCPPVFGCIEHTMEQQRRHTLPEPRQERRRQRVAETPAPDVRFRWRLSPEA
jgi:HD-GYP domain-containing protein (c-di-GMP phosphodiesterase class II)